ncbi:MAG: HAMP domain-containing sensor histidine kinase [Anaerocolumna sp.]
MEQIKRILKQIYDYHKSEQVEHRDYQKRRAEMRMQNSALRFQKRELKTRLGILKRFPEHSTKKEQYEIIKKISEINSRNKEIHLKLMLNPFSREDDNFDNYYRHIRRTRPFVLFFNLLLWFLLFWFGGFTTGLKIVIFLFAFLTTFGSIFEMLFLIQIKERILKPIDNLIKGANEIAQGNNEVIINNEYTSEISSLIEAFNEMALKLKEAEYIKSEYERNRKALIANISHDLKTPITSIQGYAEMITGSVPMETEQIARYLKIIYNNATYMNRLIEDLFLFSKLDMQKLDFHFEEIKIRPLIQDMLEEFSLDLNEHKISLEYIDTLTDEYVIKLDAKRFFQIIHNIIGNAVIHSPDTELKIIVKLYDEDRFICLDIADNGSGISRENLPHIFERFYRSEAERTKSLTSTGLGLAISKELIQAHGGEITVTSEINKGSCFRIALPYLQKLPLQDAHQKPKGV